VGGLVGGGASSGVERDQIRDERDELVLTGGDVLDEGAFPRAEAHLPVAPRAMHVELVGKPRISVSLAEGERDGLVEC